MKKVDLYKSVRGSKPSNVERRLTYRKILRDLHTSGLEVTENCFKSNLLHGDQIVGEMRIDYPEHIITLKIEQKEYSEQLAFYESPLDQLAFIILKNNIQIKGVNT